MEASYKALNRKKKATNIGLPITPVGGAAVVAVAVSGDVTVVISTVPVTTIAKVVLSATSFVPTVVFLLIWLLRKWVSQLLVQPGVT